MKIGSLIIEVTTSGKKSWLVGLTIIFFSEEIFLEIVETEIGKLLKKRQKSGSAGIGMHPIFESTSGSKNKITDDKALWQALN